MRHEESLDPRPLLLGEDDAAAIATEFKLRARVSSCCVRDQLSPKVCWTTDRGRVVVLEAGPGTIELLDERQAELVDEVEAGRRVAGKVRLALHVGDSEATAEQLIAAGAEPVASPVTTPWGDRNTRVRAPDGMQLTLFTTPS